MKIPNASRTLGCVQLLASAQLKLLLLPVITVKQCWQHQSLQISLNSLLPIHPGLQAPHGILTGPSAPSKEELASQASGSSLFYLPSAWMRGSHTVFSTTPYFHSVSLLH